MPVTPRWRTLAGIASIVVGVAPLTAQPHSAVPTFTKDVAPILYKNCTVCHRKGGMGPMPLTTYDDAKRSAGEMRDAVGTGFMPPWHADAPHGTFSNDRRLSAADKQVIAAWVDAGTPEGNPADLPPAPVYPSSWQLGTPDVILKMPVPFEVPAKGTIDYQYIEIPTNFTEDKWVQAIEMLPGAREVVHHVIVYARPPAPAPGTTPPASAPAANAPRTPPLMVFNDAHFAPRAPRDPNRPQRRTGPMIAGMAPGTEIQYFPAGTALKVPAGAVLTLQMHYTAHGHAMTDQTQIGFRFASAPPAEEIRGGTFVNDAFVLPAGQANVEVPSEVGFSRPVRIWGMLPHTHLRGKKWEYRVVYPDGRTENILSVPNYDFNWQTYYMFAKPLDLPAGAKIEARAWYDNSAANPANPDPKIDVRWGDQTWEEMQFTAFLYSLGKP